MFRVVVAALLSGFFIAQPHADEACYRLEPLAQAYSSAGAAVIVVPPEGLSDFVHAVEAATGKSYGAVDAAFAVQTSVGLEVGFEVDGCLLPPIVLGSFAVPGGGA